MAALTATQLDRLSNALNQQYQAVLRDLREEQAHPDEQHRIDLLNGEPGDAGDESLANALSDFNLERANRRAQTLLDIEAALERIKADEYGVCIDCGLDIGYTRLQAYPTAKRCIVCQNKHERTYAQDGQPSL